MKLKQLADLVIEVWESSSQYLYNHLIDNELSQIIEEGEDTIYFSDSNYVLSYSKQYDCLVLYNDSNSVIVSFENVIAIVDLKLIYSMTEKLRML